MWAKYKASYSASLSKAADYTFISLRTLISKRKKWCRELWQGQLLPKQVLAHLTKTVEFGVRIIPYIRRLSRILWDLCYSLRTLTTKGEGNVGSQEQSGPAYACCHFWKQHQGLLQQLLPACSIPHNTFWMKQACSFIRHQLYTPCTRGFFSSFCLRAVYHMT